MKNAFYFLKPELFEKIGTYSMFKDVVSQHMYFVCDYRGEFWAIPTSTNYEKYKNWYMEAKKEGKRNKFLIFINLLGKDAVLLVQNMIPITEEYIDRFVAPTANSSGGFVTLDDKTFEFLQKRMKHVLTAHKAGYLKLNSDVDAIREILYKKEQ